MAPESAMAFRTLHTAWNITFNSIDVIQTPLLQCQIAAMSLRFGWKTRSPFSMLR